MLHIDSKYDDVIEILSDKELLITIEKGPFGDINGEVLAEVIVEDIVNMNLGLF